MELNKEDYKKYIPLIVIALLVIISFLLVQRFLIPIITAFILAYLIRPLQEIINKKTSKTISIIASIIIVFLMIMIPFGAMIAGTVTQTSSILRSQEFDSFLEKLSNLELTKNLGIEIDEIVSRALNFLISSLTDFSSYIASAIIGLLVIMISMYYILYDWEKINKKIIKYFPTKNKEKFAKEVSFITDKLIYGTLVIAIIEFAIGAIGFGLFGVRAYLLLAFIIAIFAFIPGLGAAVVWVPLLIFSIIQENYIQSVGIFITGVIISLFIDIILRSKIAGKSTGIHPLTIFIGLFGGISLFGISGIIIGPLILSYTIKIIEEIANP